MYALSELNLKLETGEDAAERAKRQTQPPSNASLSLVASQDDTDAVFIDKNEAASPLSSDLVLLSPALPPRGDEIQNAMSGRKSRRRVTIGQIPNHLEKNPSRGRTPIQSSLALNSSGSAEPDHEEVRKAQHSQRSVASLQYFRTQLRCC